MPFITFISILGMPTVINLFLICLILWIYCRKELSSVVVLTEAFSQDKRNTEAGNEKYTNQQINIFVGKNSGDNPSTP